MINSFASSLWMMPFSKYCKAADAAYWKHFSGGNRKSQHVYQCEEQEFRSNYSGWPTNIINIEIPSIRGKSLSSCILKWSNYLSFYSLLYFA